MKEKISFQDFDILGVIELDDVQGIEKYVTPVRTNGTKATFLSRSKEYYNVKTMSELASSREELKTYLTQELSKRNFVILENMANCSARSYFKMFERYIVNKKDSMYEEKMKRARECLIEDVKNIMTILEGKGKLEIDTDKVFPYGNENSEQRAIEMDNKAMLYLFAKTLKFSIDPEKLEILIPGYGATYIGPMFRAMYGYDFTSTLKSKYIDTTIRADETKTPMRELMSSERILQGEKSVLLLDDNVGTGSTIRELRESLKREINADKKPNIITGAIQYNWRNYYRVSTGDKKGIDRFELRDFDIVTPYNYTGHKLLKHAIAMLLSSGEEYIDYLHSKNYRREDYSDLEGMVVRGLKYAQRAGLKLTEKSGISKRIQEKEEHKELLEQYKNGPTTITNPISIKTMKDFIAETEQIVNPQIREDELAI